MLTYEVRITKFFIQVLKPAIERLKKNGALGKKEKRK
jgi:hypothetical protein